LVFCSERAGRLPLSGSFSRSKKGSCEVYNYSSKKILAKNFF